MDGGRVLLQVINICGYIPGSSPKPIEPNPSPCSFPQDTSSSEKIGEKGRGKQKVGSSKGWRFKSEM